MDIDTFPKGVCGTGPRSRTASLPATYTPAKYFVVHKYFAVLPLLQNGHPFSQPTSAPCPLHPCDPKKKAYCTESFGSTKLAPVLAQGQTVAELREGCDRIMNLLRLNFYMLDYAVAADLDRKVLTVRATAPATIWGQQVLAQRRDRPANDFEAKVVSAYLRACGLEGATYSTAFSNLDAVHTFRL